MSVRRGMSMRLTAVALALASEILFLHLTALQHVFAAGREIFTAERGGAERVLVAFGLVKADFLGLEDAAALLNTSAKASEQGFKTLAFLTFDFNHNDSLSFLTKNR